MRPKLLIAECENFSPDALRQLNNFFDVTCAELGRQELLDKIGEFEIVWVRLRNLIDAEVFAAASQLRVLATNTTGLNHIDLHEAARLGVHVISLRGEIDFLKTIRATAEMTLALTLAVLRHIPIAHRHVYEGGWNRSLFQGTEIFEQTVGVVGYGRLGRIVSSLFNAFGAKVSVCDPNLAGISTVDDFPVLSLPELLTSSKIVSLHANSTSENEKLFGVAEFRRMQTDAVFINTARGELVDEHAMLDSVASGHLKGLGIDVLSSEHTEFGIRQSLRRLINAGYNIVVTPHIGGYTTESLSRTEKFLAARIIEFFGICGV